MSKAARRIVNRSIDVRALDGGPSSMDWDRHFVVVSTRSLASLGKVLGRELVLSAKMATFKARSFWMEKEHWNNAPHAGKKTLNDVTLIGLIFSDPADAGVAWALLKTKMHAPSALVASIGPRCSRFDEIALPATGKGPAHFEKEIMEQAKKMAWNLKRNSCGILDVAGEPLRIFFPSG